MCTKMKFATRKAATKGRAKVRWYGGNIRPYKCPKCHYYHLTTQAKRIRSIHKGGAA